MGSALVHKLARGLPPWSPIKGHHMKSYKQIQSEAIEKREREKAVLRNNGGIWPGESAPAHAMFLWASGSELTDILEQGTKQNMPHKFISYEARYVSNCWKLSSMLLSWLFCSFACLCLLSFVLPNQTLSFISFLHLGCRDERLCCTGGVEGSCWAFKINYMASSLDNSGHNFATQRWKLSRL